LANRGPSDLKVQDPNTDVEIHWTAKGPLVIRASFYRNQAVLHGRIIPREIVEEFRVLLASAGFSAKDIIQITTNDLGTEVQIPHRLLGYSHGLVDSRVVEGLLSHGFKVLSSTFQPENEVIWFVYNPPSAV